MPSHLNAPPAAESIPAVPAAEPNRPARHTATWLAAAIVALPFTQTLEWDVERLAPLALFPPALWSGRTLLTRAFARFDRAPHVVRWLTGLLAVIAVAATATADQPAAALVTLSSWILLGLGALLAGQVIAEEPRLGTQLLGALAASVALATVLHWTRWQLGAEAKTAFYPHHRIMGLHTLGGAFAATALLATASRLRVVWLALGILAWGGLLWTGSRTPLLALLFALSLWIVRSPAATRRRLALATIVLLIGGLGLSFALEGDEGYLGWSRLWQRTVEVDSAQALTSNRSVFWLGAWQQFLHSPWLGHGPDAYRYLEPKLEGAQPHNVVLQLLLDLGLFGAVAATVLIGCAILRGWERAPASDGFAAWPMLAIASGTAGQLDGFFYHQSGLMTAALALGICLGAHPRDGASAPAPPARTWHRAWPLPVGAAAVVLVLHFWIFYRVALAPPPAPDSAVVRVWRAFPSSSLGLERWIDAWSGSAPDAALALARDARRHSTNADYFQVRTAGLLLARGDRAGALKELDQALAIAPWPLRPVIEQLRAQVAAGAKTGR